MQIRNKYLSAAWKLLASAAGTLGILLQCGVFSGKPDFSVLNYFTLMSNVLCAVYFLCAAVQLLRGRPAFWKRAKGAMLLCILVTGLVYHFMLHGRFEMQGTLFWSNTLLHYVVPVMSLLDWLLFDEKGAYSWRDPFLWLLAPTGYFIYVVVRVHFGAILGPYGSPYPYFFMDAGTLGWGLVLAINLGLLAGFLLLGLLLTAVDKALARVGRSCAAGSQRI